MGSSVEYWELHPQLIQSHLQLREQLVSYEEWIVGSCMQPFRRIEEPVGILGKATYWDLEYLLMEPENIGSASVFYGETGEMLLLSRLFDGIDEVLNELIAPKVQNDEPGGKSG